MDDRTQVSKSLRSTSSDRAEPSQHTAEDKMGLDGDTETLSASPPSDTSRRRLLLRRFWMGAKGFWGKSGERSAWWLSGAVVLIVVLNLGTLYGMNLWNRGIFDALDKRDLHRVFVLAMVYFPLLAASVFLASTQVYARMTMQRRWRAWLTHHLVDRWLANGRYYQLNLVSGDHQNPEFRIADDVRIATELPIEFTTGVLSAFLSAATFIFVLWTIGGPLEFPIGGLHVSIPGFLVVAAVLYSVIASGAMVLIGRRFVHVSERKNQAEAEYRYILTRLRENGESIALIRGEDEERAGVDHALGSVLRNWRDICRQTIKTTIVSQTSGYIAPVLPILLCAPKYLAGTMSLGEVMQAASAFTIVQAAFNWLVDNYPRLADWTASARRVSTLMLAFDALETAEKGFGRIERTDDGEDAALKLANLSITLDDGTAVVDEAEVSIMPGERVLISGESGSGKSTLIRAIAGLWPWGEGKIEVRKGAKIMFLPQRPYIPVGSLRRAAAYPDPADSRTTEEVARALEFVGLEKLVPEIDEEAPWDQTLSGGEKQRLAFARIVLHQPDIIIMDEATAALDPTSQNQLMELLLRQPEQTTLISVGHRPELELFHRRKIVLERRRGGTRLVSDVHLEPRPSLTGLVRRWLGRGSDDRRDKAA